MASSRKKPSMTRPMMIFGDLGNRTLRARPGTIASAAPSGVPAAPGVPPAPPVPPVPRSVVVDKGSCLLAGPGVEQHVHEVRGQVGGQDGERDDEEDPLEQ